MSKETKPNLRLSDIAARCGSTRLRTPYDGRHIRYIVHFDKPSRTKQEFKDQCDVNRIVENFTRTGRLDQLQAARGFYADISAHPDSYQESLNLVLEAREAFDMLPAETRAMFGNDVQNFLYAAQNSPDEVFGVLKPSEAPQEPEATSTPKTKKKAPEPSQTDLDDLLTEPAK
nr:MAG: internal scaffolding protein [Microvirus sp.]